MTTIREALVMASEHQSRGELADAEGIYRLVLTLQPNNAIALNNLGLLVPEQEAVGLFRRAVAAMPGYAHALANLAGALQHQGEASAALTACRQAVTECSDDPRALFHFGGILEAQGQLDEAAAVYDRATTLEPDFSAALFRLGAIHVVSKRHDAAADCYRRALAIAPDSLFANLNMAGTLEADGKLAEARLFRDRIPRPMALLVQTAPDARRTVLILGNGGKGNVPLQGLLPLQTTTWITWYVEFATAAQEADLPPYDVAINAIGDADVIEEQAACVNRLHARRPVINPPDRVASTRRDRMPLLLAGLDGVLAPAVARCAREALDGADLPALLAAEGIACPVLVRPIVAHGGEGMMRADTPDALAALRLVTADAYYFTAFHDFCSADGYYRKYRVIFVDRRPYAYHLAISAYWLVHYFSADMLEAPWKREEERAFLENPAAALGPRAMAAIMAIGMRLDLDFAGIDFSVLPDGRVLVFEANATMLVHLNESAEDFPYKHVAVPAIFEAFDAMLDRHRH